MKAQVELKLALMFGILLDLWPYLLFPWTHFRIFVSAWWSSLLVKLVTQMSKQLDSKS